MPWSSGTLRAVAVEHITSINPSTVLDVGAGAGTWQTWYRNAHWTALEIWEPYIERFDLRSRYDELIIGDARTVPLGGPYDLAILGDVLEHVEDPLSLYERIRGVARYVLVQVPVGYWPQGDEEGNPSETHLTIVTQDEVRYWPGVTYFYLQDDIALAIAEGKVS